MDKPMHERLAAQVLRQALEVLPPGSPAPLVKAKAAESRDEWHVWVDWKPPAKPPRVYEVPLHLEGVERPYSVLTMTGQEAAAVLGDIGPATARLENAKVRHRLRRILRGFDG